MTNLDFNTEFELGDIVVAEVTFQNGMRVRKAFVYGVITAIDTKTFIRDEKPQVEIRYDILESNGGTYGSIEKERVKTIQQFVTHHKKNLYALANSNNEYINPAQREGMM